MAKRDLHVLIVEDSADDTQLMLREVERGGYSVFYERVETKADMQAALSRQAWDIILSDYSMPSFSALAALETLKAVETDTFREFTLPVIGILTFTSALDIQKSVRPSSSVPTAMATG